MAADASRGIAVRGAIDMALKHLVLGILRAEPAHGYRVALRLAALAGSLRRIEPARVYETLADLEREGAVAPRRDVSGVRERRVWETTESGRRELDRWFARPVPSAVWLRRPLLARLAIAGPADRARTEAARGELAARRRALARAETAERSRATVRVEPEAALRAALDRADRARERAQCEAEIELLEGWIALASEAGKPPSPDPGVSLPPRKPFPPLPEPARRPGLRPARASR